MNWSHAKLECKDADKASNVIDLMGLIEALACEVNDKKHPA